MRAADVLMDPEFEELRESFCRENCRHFEVRSPNPLRGPWCFAPRCIECCLEGCFPSLGAVSRVLLCYTLSHYHCVLNLLQPLPFPRASALQDSDENKLIYTDLFARYTSLVENTIESKLKEAVPGFSMAEFSSLLETHRDSLMSDVFDLLLSMGDFESFKEVMLSYKREVEDGRSSFGVHCTPLKIHTQVGWMRRA